MSSSNSTKSPSLVLVPVSPHAVAIVYNIPSFPDIPSGLQLDPAALVKIFTGKVTYWDDPAIKSLNSNLNLPHEKIVVVHLNKAESSTDLLTQYLASNGTKNNQIEWTATSQIVPDATALSSLIQRTPYSIGYIDYAYAVQTKMTYAALQNSDGKFSLPSQDSISRAIQNGTVIGNATNLGNLTTNSSSGNSSRNYTSLAGNSLPVTNIGHIGNGSYPIVGLYFAGFFLNNTATSSLNSNATNAAVQDFANWIVGNEGQRLLQDAQYPSIYDSNLLKLYLKQKLGIVTQ
jgi:phosphate transport system substrate-binding protein